jgi:hypothetical protein
MSVSLWAVLGIALLIVGLPMVILLPTDTAGAMFGYVVGAGAAFVVVAYAQWWTGGDQPSLEEEAGLVATDR